MALKPEIKLAENQSFQHPSGKFEKRIRARDLRENPTMVRTFPHLYKNAVEMQREDSLKGSVTKGKSDVVVANKITIKSTGESRVVISAAPKKAVSASRSTLDKLARNLNAENARNGEVVKPNAATPPNKAEKELKADKLAADLQKKAEKDKKAADKLAAEQAEKDITKDIPKV